MGKFSLESDPRGLIYEAYRISGIATKDCRTIFFDWALGLKPDLDPIKEIKTLYNSYALENPGHPMNLVLQEGLSNFTLKPKRRRRSR